MSMVYRQVEQGEPGDEARFNGEGGVRRQWWWQAGPVDSCCFCCSLRAGVGILAAMDLFVRGIWSVFYSKADNEKLMHTAIAQLQSLYSKKCVGAAVETEDCRQLSHQIEQMEFKDELFDNLPAIVYVQAVIAMLAGVVGLFAVFKSNALTAKIYLWTWLPRFVLGVVSEYAVRAQMKELGIDNSDGVPVVIGELIGVVVVLYYIKVTWSFYKRLTSRSGNFSSPSGDVESIQLA